MPEIDGVSSMPPTAAEFGHQDDLLVSLTSVNTAVVGRLPSMAPLSAHQQTRPLSAVDNPRWADEQLFHKISTSVLPDSDYGGIFLSDSDALTLQLHDDIQTLPATTQSSGALSRCHRFYQQTADLLTAPRLKCAVFGDDDGTVTFLAHSGKSKRQVSFEFAPDKDSVVIVSIDEHMRRTEDRRLASAIGTLRAAVGWLSQR